MGTRAEDITVAHHPNTWRSRTTTGTGCDRRDDAAWRADLLTAAGLAPTTARAVGARPDVDIHRLVSLLEGGCPVHLALRIADLAMDRP